MSKVRLIDAEALKKDLICFYPEGVPSGLDSETMLKQILHDIDNAPTVKTYETFSYEKGFQDGEYCAEMERVIGKRPEKALSIIDRLYTEGHINNMEQGVLRRAILLPEKGGAT